MTSKTKYHFLLLFQINLLVVDAIFNTLSEFAGSKPELQLVVFVFQDVFIVLSLTVMLVSIFSTGIFQAGLVNILYKRFKQPVFISLLYIGMTISLHATLLTYRWENPLSYNWTPSLLAFFGCHKMLSTVYYYSTKRAMLNTSDPSLEVRTPVTNGLVDGETNNNVSFRRVFLTRSSSIHE